MIPVRPGGQVIRLGCGQFACRRAAVPAPSILRADNQVDLPAPPECRPYDKFVRSHQIGSPPAAVQVEQRLLVERRVPVKGLGGRGDPVEGGQRRSIGCTKRE